MILESFNSSLFQLQNKHAFLAHGCCCWIICSGEFIAEQYNARYNGSHRRTLTAALRGQKVSAGGIEIDVGDGVIDAKDDDPYTLVIRLQLLLDPLLKKKFYFPEFNSLSLSFTSQ